MVIYVTIALINRWLEFSSHAVFAAHKVHPIHYFMMLYNGVCVCVFKSTAKIEWKKIVVRIKWR